MYPFWDIVIAPVLEAVGAKRVIEIGALRGDTTVLMLELLGPDAELHVIDPVPQFDPSEHEQQFPGRYIFHRDISHNVLPQLPVADVALVDGDHNWYTVYNELKMLSATAREAGAQLPVLMMHDVGWPYGRRDLYYAPERIPKEFRQRHNQRGMMPGHSKLRGERWGMNPTMNNAVQEGGPRNGVMTALDDFVEEHDKPVRRIVLPIYFGLAIVAEEERLANQPKLAAVFDHLEGPEARYALLELAESIRINATIFQHNFFFSSLIRFERDARRYLSLLKGALLDEHYIEHEIRLEYLADCIEKGKSPDKNRVRDPARYMPREVLRLRRARRAGSGHATGAAASIAYTTIGRARLDHLEQCLDTIRTERVEGDLVACGAGRGGDGIFLRGYLAAFSEMEHERVWVADPFRAVSVPSRSEDADSATTRQLNLKGDLNIVRDAFDRFDLLDKRVRFLQGSFTDTLPDAPIDKVALLRIGASAADSAGDVLEALYHKVPLGGFVIVDGHESPACEKAIDKFRSDRGVEEQIERVGAGTISWRKLQHAAEGSPAPQAGPREHAPTAPALPADHCDLSVVVVFYNMRRESERTLHALTRIYQEGIDDLDYEVIAVENGSSEDQKLGEEFVREFGPEFRYLDLGEEATPSPANALNRGVAVARGKAIALMIDGAHVLTPGAFRFGMLALEAYEPAVVITQPWYVGPGQQREAMKAGYDTAYEDRLFEEIEWPVDGYRLFEVGHFVGDRDWFDGLAESNCILVPRSLLEQSGGMDEVFSMPGGGFANLDFYERMCSTAGVTVASVLGEASFHQMHGGTTTNEPGVAERHENLSSYRQHYRQVRGRVFHGHGKYIHYVGSLPQAARRTRVRRMVAPLFFKPGLSAGNGRPEKPTPIPDDLKAGFTEAFWQSLAWEGTTWLGHRVGNCPTDLLAYQDLIAEVKPAWVIETGAGDGGRALFLATICELVDHGQVLSINPGVGEDHPKHPRLRYLEGNPIDESTIEQVREIVGETPNALVILGSSRGVVHMAKEFELYSPFAAIGSYVVMINTILNGNPVLPEFGAGPAEAVNQIMRTRSDFEQDPYMEKYGLTFNPGGFLKRMG
jgi:cephalosporin hydroxylase